MDFQKLTRRELQALCKMNKIPANMTNIAMADALRGLDVVQGMQEFLQPARSETMESSVESPVKIEVTSPNIPPTGGRSTRRRKVSKEDPETMTRTRADRKKAVETSAFKKMDSWLKGCVEDEKKDLLSTPAPLGVASRRRRSAKEESVAQRVYSTRRSTRLAEKTMGAVNNVLEKDVFDKYRDYVMMNLTEGSDDLEQMSGTTGEEFKPVEEKDEPEDVSSQDLGASVGKERWLECLGEEEESLAVGSEAEVKIDIHMGTEEYWFDLESKAGSGSMKLGGMEDFEDDCTITLLTEGSQAQDTNGKYIVRLGTEESEFDLEKTVATVEEELRDEDSVVSIAETNESHGVEGVTNDLSISESKVTFGNSAALITDEDECPDTDMKVESEGVHCSVVNEDTATNVKHLVNECRKELNSGLANELEADEELTSMLCDAISVKDIDEEVKEEDADGIVIVQAEEDIKEIVHCEAAEAKHVAVVRGEYDFPSQSAALDLNSNAFEEEDACVGARIPINGSARKASSMKKGMKHVLADNNKENIDSAGKLVLTKETAQMVKKTASVNGSNLDALSIRKLSKMLKDKLQITNDHNKNKKNGDEVSGVV